MSSVRSISYKKYLSPEISFQFLKKGVVNNKYLSVDPRLLTRHVYNKCDSPRMLLPLSYSHIQIYLTLYQTGFFELLMVRGFFGPRQKNSYNSSLLHPNHLKLGKIHLCALPQILTIVT